MKYVLMFIWRIVYWVVAAAVTFGSLFLVMEGLKSVTDSLILSVVVGGVLWMVVAYWAYKPLTKIDEFLKAKASLDEDAYNAQVKMVLVPMSVLAVLVLVTLSFLYVWIDDMFVSEAPDIDVGITIVFFVFATVAVFIYSLKKYKKYKEYMRD